MHGKHSIKKSNICLQVKQKFWFESHIRNEAKIIHACAFLIVFRLITLRMRCLDESYRENQNKHFIFNNLLPEICALFSGNVKNCGKNMVEP